MNNNQDRVTFTDDLTIKFEGENTIDVQQLFGYITGIEEAYQASLNAEYHSPEMKLKVVAINKGSFEIILQSAVALAPDLIRAIPTAVTTFKELMEMIQIKRELKGQKPQSVETEGKMTKIVNAEGDITYHNCTVANYFFNNPQIDAGMVKAFTALTRGSEPREAISLSSAQETLRIEQGTFPAISAAIISTSENEDHKQISTLNTDLRVAKLDFVGDTMWSFLDRDDKKITATIEDDKFLSDVRNGKIKLSANVILRTRLRIEAELNDFLEVVKKRIFVEEVIGTKEEPKVEQTTLAIDGI